MSFVSDAPRRGKHPRGDGEAELGGPGLGTEIKADKGCSLSVTAEHLFGSPGRVA